MDAGLNEFMFLDVNIGYHKTLEDGVKIQFEIWGTMDVDNFKELLKVIEEDELTFRSEFGNDVVTVLFIDYESEDSKFSLGLAKQ